MELQRIPSLHDSRSSSENNAPSPDLIRLISSRPRALEAIYQYDTGASKAERHAALTVLYENFSQETVDLILKNREKLKAIFLQ